MAYSKKVLALATSLIILSPLAAIAQSATYYSNWYIGRKTASGATFSQHKLTAAHPTLRLGTRVRVTNRQTGKSVVVTINDRCNCSIDLSKAAFQRIGKLSRGRIPVRISR